METGNFVLWLFLATAILVLIYGIYSLARTRRAKRTNEHSAMGSNMAGRVHEAERRVEARDARREAAERRRDEPAAIQPRR